MQKSQVMNNDHAFKRTNGKCYCKFCQDLWPSIEAVSNYQLCSKCETTVHSSCKVLAIKCIPCVKRDTSVVLPMPTKTRGNVFLQLKQIYDIEVIPGTLLYGIFRFGESIILRTQISQANGNECVWSNGAVSQPSLPAVTVQEILNYSEVTLEIWSHVFTIFDKIIYSAKINLAPMLSYPNVLIERWFVVQSYQMSISSRANGKVLIELMFAVDDSDSNDILDALRPVSVEQKISVIPSNEQELSRSAPEKKINQYATQSLSNDAGQSIIQDSTDGVPSNEIVQKEKEPELDATFGSPFFRIMESTVFNLGNVFYELEAKNGPPSSSQKLQTLDPIEPSPTLQIAGNLVIFILTAYKYKVKDPGEGDHFVSVTVDGLSQKFSTAVVHQSATPIFNSKFTIPVPNFRAKIEVSLVDAISNVKIGSTSFTPYEVAHNAADEKIARVFQIASQMDSFSKYKIMDNLQQNIIGHFEMNVAFEENPNLHLFSSTVASAPTSPEEELSMDRLNLHVVRFSCLIDMVANYYQSYLDIMDWKDPIYTSILFFSFLYFTLHVHSDYLLSGITFIAVLGMSNALIYRLNGKYIDQYISKNSKKSTSLYRPIAWLRIGAIAFRVKNPTSTPKNSSSKLEDATKAPLLKVVLNCLEASAGIDRQSEKEYTVGYLNNSLSQQQLSASGHEGVSQFMKNFLGTDTDQKDVLLQNVFDVSTDDDEESLFMGMDGVSKSLTSHLNLVYPILEPLILENSKENTSLSDPYQSHCNAWKNCPARIKLSLINENGKMSHIHIRLSDLILKGENVATGLNSNEFKIVQWFPSFVSDPKNENAEDAVTEVLLRVSLQIPSHSTIFFPSKMDVRNSHILQSVFSDQTEKESTTLSVLWNMRDNVTYVQNLMNRILDYAESFKNLLNWTAPEKTWPIYITFISIWVVTAFIPTRALIFFFGLYQFFYIFLPIPDGDDISIRFLNLLQSVPNDDDLQQIYTKHREELKKVEDQTLKQTVNKTLLSISLPILWSGNIHLKSSLSNSSATVFSEVWNSVFIIFQGKRIVWWSREKDLLEGKAPIGQMILSPLGGITQVSPLDVRKFEDDSKLMAIVGQDICGKPFKISLLLGSFESKQYLERNIHS